MREELKAVVKSMTALSKGLRKEELKLKGWKDFLSQTSKKKHKKDEPKPKARVQPENFPENAQELYDEAELKRWNLWEKRTREVRQQARVIHLAYNFILNNSYNVVEQDPRYPLNEKLAERVQAAAMRYWDGDHRLFRQKFAEWLDEAKKYVASLEKVEEVVAEEVKPTVH